MVGMTVAVAVAIEEACKYEDTVAFCKKLRKNFIKNRRC